MQTIPIENAGLVLFAPYLDKLFSVLELLNKSTVEAANTKLLRRVLLLQYMASGTEDIAGVDLSLNFLLSGNNSAGKINLDFKLTAQEKQLADHLVSILIADWEHLGKMDAAELRESFLIRPGKLNFGGNAWYLDVEKKSFDILLDSLPWDISSVKLNGMALPLTVKWR